MRRPSGASPSVSIGSLDKVADKPKTKNDLASKANVLGAGGAW
ncbi:MULTISPECIES: hypothetical protein [unclassified Streptomyces]|nr:MULTISPECIES: hypothetical protein [unclassified Streptomyces]